jgi:hypothetical protein
VCQHIKFESIAKHYWLNRYALLEMRILLTKRIFKSQFTQPITSLTMIKWASIINFIWQKIFTLHFLRNYIKNKQMCFLRNSKSILTIVYLSTTTIERKSLFFERLIRPKKKLSQIALNLILLCFYVAIIFPIMLKESKL